jgi:hypothetical protein
MALLDAPFTVTTTLPVVAPVGTGAAILVLLQLDGEAGVPLNRTELVPADAPKLLPLTVTIVPVVPVDGLSEVMAGTELVATGLKEAIESATWLDSEYEKLVVVVPVATGPFIVITA